MELIELRSKDEFQNYFNIVKTERLKVENLLEMENVMNEKWNIIGYCELCEKATKFELNWNNSKNHKLNFRGIFVCEFCKLPNRKRAMLSILKKKIQNNSSNLSIYMYEETTRVFKHAKKKFQDIQLIGSEFLGADKNPGEIVNGIHHEDAMNLSLNDNSFDYILSNDVFEHVPNIEKALKEAYRVLKPNGELLISIPFNVNLQKTVKRTTIENGQIKNILPPIFHQNPLSKEGSLVFYDYGWDFLTLIKNSGFKDALMLGYYSMFFGYVGNALQFIFLARK